MKVSVVMITYNHEKFIQEAIEGILMQECNFDLELIIANDCSVDKTDEVIQNILKNHPKATFINYINQENNIGMMPNFIFALQQTKAKYIALCEGDDYWTDPQKLQKQIDFLEANLEYSICFHNVKEIDINGNEMTNKILESHQTEIDYTLLDLVKGNFIHTTSVIFRKNFDALPPWMEFSPIGDYPLHILNAQYGKIKYFPQTMANYRVGSGIYSSQSFKQNAFKFSQTLSFLISHFKNEKEIREILEQQRENLLHNVYYFNESSVLSDITNKLTLKSVILLVIIKLRLLAFNYYQIYKLKFK